MRIVRADGSIIEGSPAEIAEFEGLTTGTTLAKVRDDSAEKDLELSVLSDDSDGESLDYTSTDVAFRCLTRLKLSKPMKATLRLLYAADRDWVSAADIQRQIGYDAMQFGGMLGAFGRRLVNTSGYVLNSSFFDYEWDQALSCYRYRLPLTVRAAIVQARLVA